VIHVRHSIPEEIEESRDSLGQRDGEGRVETAVHAERFVERVGFASCFSDSRKPQPSLYVAVCGRRDAVIPRNVQKDPECRLAWTIKDEVIRRGRIYYAKLVRARATFIASRLVPYFNDVWGVSRNREGEMLSDAARSVLKVLRHEWEMGTRDLREASGISDRAQFNKAIDELQKTLKVIPSEVVYEPGFTYIWSLAEGRFPEELKRKVGREVALREIARTYLAGAKLTLAGELARATGLSRADAGLGNWALVDEGFAQRLAPGVYKLAKLELAKSAAGS